MESAARFHPGPVLPPVVEIPDDRRRAGCLLVKEPHRVGLRDLVAAVARDDPVLVERALADVGHEPLPDARAIPQPEPVALRIPVVEIPDGRDRNGVGRPDREEGTAPTARLARMGAQCSRCEKYFIPAHTIEYLKEILKESLINGMIAARIT